MTLDNQGLSGSVLVRILQNQQDVRAETKTDYQELARVNTEADKPQIRSWQAGDPGRPSASVPVQRQEKTSSQLHHRQITGSDFGSIQAFK